MALKDTDYLRQLQALLPPGPAWPKDDDAALTRLLDALAAELARVDGRANGLLEEADPRTTAEFLEDWERVAGLPSPCVAAMDRPQSQGERVASLVGKLTSLGGQSIAYFVGLAASLGYRITISEYMPFRVGRGRCGDALCGEEWQFVWAVNAGATTVTPFLVGRSAAGDPLAAWGNARLLCEFERLKPAHTTIIFRFDSVSVMDSRGDIFIIDEGTL